MKLSDLSIKQLARLYRKAWERMTQYDGYQPFGYDAITIRTTRPGWYKVLRAISNAHKIKREIVAS